MQRFLCKSFDETCNVVYFNAHIVSFFSKALDDSTLCPESNTTINFVTSCPLSENEWLIAASKMNCQSIENNCASFVYHCVMDSNMTRMIEVCGPVTIIVGKYLVLVVFFISDMKYHRP